MTGTIGERLKGFLERLRLKSVLQGLPHQTNQALAQGHSYSEFLERLLQEEVARRDEEALKRLLIASRLPAGKTLETFDFGFQPTIDRRQIHELAGLSFLQRHENVIFLGPPGVGKSHLAAALGVQVCRAHRSVYWTTLDDLVKQLHGDRSWREPARLRGGLRSSLIIVDEVGYLPLERKEANLFFQFVAHRYEKASLILTSNKDFTEWSKTFGESALAAAILDRLLHHAHILSIEGDSYRLKHYKKSDLAPKKDQQGGSI